MIFALNVSLHPNTFFLKEKIVCTHRSCSTCLCSVFHFYFHFYLFHLFNSSIASLIYYSSLIFLECSWISFFWIKHVRYRLTQDKREKKMWKYLRNILKLILCSVFAIFHLIWLCSDNIWKLSFQHSTAWCLAQFFLYMYILKSYW